MVQFAFQITACIIRSVIIQFNHDLRLELPSTPLVHADQTRSRQFISDWLKKVK